MGRYDGEDYPDESGYVSRAMQDAVKRGFQPAEGFSGYPETQMYPICQRCTFRHVMGAGCVGEVGRRDREKLAETARLKRTEADLIAAKTLLQQSGYTVTNPHN